LSLLSPLPFNILIQVFLAGLTKKKE